MHNDSTLAMLQSGCLLCPRAVLPSVREQCNAHQGGENQ